MTLPIGSNRRNGNIHTLASLREAQRKREMSSSDGHSAQRVRMSWQQGNAVLDRALRKVEQTIAEYKPNPTYSLIPDSHTVRDQTAETSLQVQRDLVQSVETLQTKPSVQEPNLSLTISTKTAPPRGNIHTLASLREDQRKREVSSSDGDSAQQVRMAWHEGIAVLERAVRKVEQTIAEYKLNPVHALIPDAETIRAQTAETSLRVEKLLAKSDETCLLASQTIRAQTAETSLRVEKLLAKSDETCLLASQTIRAQTEEIRAQIAESRARTDEDALQFQRFLEGNKALKTSLPQRKWLLFFISIFSISFLTKIIARCKRAGEFLKR